MDGADPKAYTYSRRPVRLVILERYDNPAMAIEREKQIKRWSRKKKEALIKRNFDSLPKLSKKKFHKKN